MTKKEEPGFYSVLKRACLEILPTKVAAVFAMEISVIYYSFFAWRKRKLDASEFSYHKESSIPILLGVFIFVILIETSVIHLLLQGRSVMAAWIASGLSIYAGFQFFAILKSISRRPIEVGEKSLFLKYGLLSETVMPFVRISSVQLSGKSFEKEKSSSQLSPLGAMDGHNVILELKGDHILSGFYGMKKSFRRIAFHVDEKERFFELLEPKLK